MENRMSDQVKDYDVIILGTGLTESILSSLLSSEGKKVLHLDRNEYYGGILPVITPLEEAYRWFGRSETPPQALGSGRDYAIELAPKFFLTEDIISSSMIKPIISNYVELQSIDRSNVLISSDIHAVPYDQTAAMASSAIGLFEKKRFKDFLRFVDDLKIDSRSTWTDIDIDVQPMSDVYTHFGLSVISQQIIGHGLARYSTEDYKEHRALDVLERIKRCIDSNAVFGKSPYTFPLYSLDQLQEGAARASGTWLRGVSIQSIVLDGANNTFSGITFDGQLARATHLVGDPSYFPTRVTKSGQVVRVICVLDEPIPNTRNAQSQLIVIPGSEVNRRNDIYVTCVSSGHRVSPPGKFIAAISTMVESDNPEQEIASTINLLGPISNNASFVQISDVLEPMPSTAAEGIFISRSYDATPHFDGIYEDVRRIYLGITGDTLS